VHLVGFTLERYYDAARSYKRQTHKHVYLFICLPKKPFVLASPCIYVHFLCNHFKISEEEQKQGIPLHYDVAIIPFHFLALSKNCEN
jgi:hypothetical protein